MQYDVLENYVSSGAGTGRPASPVAVTNQYGGLYGATNIQDFAAVSFGPGHLERIGLWNESSFGFRYRARLFGFGRAQ